MHVDASGVKQSGCHLGTSRGLGPETEKPRLEAMWGREGWGCQVVSVVLSVSKGT